VTLGGSGYTRTLTVEQFADAAYAVVLAELGGFNDRTTIVRLRDGRMGTNLIDPSSWVIGSLGSQGQFWENGDVAGENAIVLGGTNDAPYGPTGASEPLWECRPSGNGEPDGGWNHYNIPVNHTKTYRSSVWLRVKNTTGSIYHGCGGGATALLDGTPEGNPYWLGTSVAGVGMTPDTWYLSVGFLHGSGYTGASAANSGLYDDRGRKIFSYTDFKTAVGASHQVHRTYHFYNLTTTQRQWMCRPRFDEVNGNEPSIADLLQAPPQTIAQSITGYLTNESATLPAAPDGTYDSGVLGTVSAGSFNVYEGVTPITSGVTYSVQAETGLDVSINAATGAYTASSMSADAGTATFRATYQGVLLDKVFTIAKSKTGEQGLSGSTGSRGAGFYHLSSALATAPDDATFSTLADGVTPDNNVFQDRVTIFNNNATPPWSVTKYWDGTWLELTQYIDGNLLVSGTIGTTALAGDAIRTSNYEPVVPGTEGQTTEVARYGAKMQRSGNALIVAADHLKVGSYTMKEPFFRALNALGNTNDRVWYRGSNDVSATGGAPSLTPGDLVIKPWAWAQIGETSMGVFHADVTLHSGNGAASNLDGMRYAYMQVYSQSAAGTGSNISLTYRGHLHITLGDRLHWVNDNWANTNNDFWTTVNHVGASFFGGVPAVLARIYNVHGSSPTHCFYSPSGWAAGTALVDNGTTFPASWGGTPPTGSVGSGSGGGGACPAPETPILLADGREILAGDLRVGDRVWTVPEHGGDPGAFHVEAVSVHASERLRTILTDGRALVTSPRHRLRVPDGWRAVQTFDPGVAIEGLLPGVVKLVEVAEPGPVVKITVGGAHTYVTAGLLSHNVKPIGDL
jgi:hypothetical protein